ncbi:DUF3352 domain-containing protein [Oscillatoria sp. FACHB-1406]|uniref:DUF3352 domain-containing protein n=1 Tax=Oscillatoria sp. FACHB-1406 TaxID=2692846 RepID=UPI00168582CB|nr:DUF3352 domain-containing protein [Oscillatoria sp. FACHB-1406]MBD2576632.1 DUF3352 domain-containing protein [Oscillatoria sp. FACHB-1406]
MNRRSPISIALALVLALLLTVGGIWYFFFSKAPLQILSGGVQKNPEAAIFVPKQAPVVVSLLVNPDELEAFAKSASPFRKRGKAGEEFAKLEQGLLANAGADYAKDIQPWLGDEVTLALTDSDFDRNSTNGEQPGYLIVAGSKDGARAKEFLQLYYSKDAAAGKSELVFEDYKGVNLIYRRNLADSSTASASAVVGDRFVLFANHLRVLRDAVNNAQAVERNLDRDPVYQKAIATIDDPRIGVAVVNLPGLAAWIAKQPLPLELKQTLTVVLSLNPRGLVAQTALAGLTGDTNVAPALSEPVKALRYIPAHPIVTAAGTDFQHFWEQVSATVASEPAFAELLDRNIARLNEVFGVNVPEEIASWALGEYAFAWLPSVEKEVLNWVFVVEKTQESQDAIARLDELAKARDLSVGNFNLDGRKIAVWTKLEAKQGEAATRLEAAVKGVHTATEKYEIFSSSLDGLTQALNDTESSLLASAEFKDAIASLPKKNDGYLYIDWNQGQDIFEQNIPLFRVVEFAGQPLFRNLRSLVLSSNGRENGIGRASLFLNLGS